MKQPVNYHDDIEEFVGEAKAAFYELKKKPSKDTAAVSSQAVKTGTLIINATRTLKDAGQLAEDGTRKKKSEVA